jgi:hypothetical protein
MMYSEITVNNCVNSQPRQVTYFTSKGIYGPRVERDTRKGTVELHGRASNAEFSKLVQASEDDFYSVKGSF